MQNFSHLIWHYYIEHRYIMYKNINSKSLIQPWSLIRSYNIIIKCNTSLYFDIGYIEQTDFTKIKQQYRQNDEWTREETKENFANLRKIYKTNYNRVSLCIKQLANSNEETISKFMTTYIIACKILCECFKTIIIVYNKLMLNGEIIEDFQGISFPLLPCT